MRYLSVCSGIEAATVAWHPLGWEPAAFSEIEAFPRAVLTHHYPDVPLHGDFTTIKGDEYGPIDLLVGGTPCQSFSVAGLRGGLADERGNLALEYLRLADRTRPRWLVWENVPGVLSSDGGKDFGTFLGGLAELGYGFAYRVLDAQFFGVPQRRRRVFVVGHLGDWRRAAAVLFERHSLSGDSPPRREKGQESAARTGFSTVGSVTGGYGAKLGTDESCQGSVIPAVYSLQGGGRTSQNSQGSGFKEHVSFTLNCMDEHAVAYTPDVAATLETTCNDYSRADGFNMIAHSLRAEGFDASEDGTGRGTPLVPVAFAQNSRDEVREIGGNIAGALAAEPGMKQQTYIAFTAKDYGADASDIAPTLRSGGHDNSHANGGVMPAVVMPLNTQIATRGKALGERTGFGIGEDGDPGFTLQAGHSHGIATHSAVRRLTPVECERLQGFPRDYTLIPYRGKPAPDRPRYKALGNSMAVPAMRWIGERIATVEALQQRREAA